MAAIAALSDRDGRLGWEPGRRSESNHYGRLAVQPWAIAVAARTCADRPFLAAGQ